MAVQIENQLHMINSRVNYTYLKKILLTDMIIKAVGRAAEQKKNQYTMNTNIGSTLYSQEWTQGVLISNQYK